MAYEYEGYVKNTIRTEAVFSHEIEQKYDRILELEEVYRKAKAFDEVVRIYNHYELNLTVDEDDTFEVIARFIQEWGNKEYLLKEDKQNGL